MPNAKAAADSTSSGDAPTFASPMPPVHAMTAATGMNRRAVGKRSWIMPHVGAPKRATAEVNAARAPMPPNPMPRLW